MDFQTEKLLKECNASSEVIKKFKENEIGLKALPYLREKQLKYLFGGKIGKIAEFCGEVSRLNNSDGYSKYITKQFEYLVYVVETVLERHMDLSFNFCFYFPKDENKAKC